MGRTKNFQYHVTLPKSLIEALGFKKGDVFRIEIQDGNIVLKKVEERGETDED